MKVINSVLALSIIANLGLIYKSYVDMGELNGLILIYIGGITLAAIGALLFVRKDSKNLFTSMLQNLAIVYFAITLGIFFLTGQPGDPAETVRTAPTAEEAIGIFQFIPCLFVFIKCSPGIKKILNLTEKTE